MYSLSTAITAVKGIGPKLAEQLAARNITTVEDFLLELPINYVDYSQQVAIGDLTPGQPVTIQAEITSVRSYFKRGGRGRGRSIQSAVAHDGTGKLNLYWFNTPYIAKSLENGQLYSISGEVNDKGAMVHPKVEKVRPQIDETLHTGRIVPRYTQTLGISQGKLRRLQSEVLEQLQISDPLSTHVTSVLPLDAALKQLHFPEQADRVTQALQRLALEELLSLIDRSHQIKESWAANKQAPVINPKGKPIPETVPYQLTGAQHRCVAEILEDLQESVPMNRLLVGDVGAGKTVVAGIAAYHTIQNGYHAALVAPTQILAEQHFETLQKLFPQLDMHLLTGSTKPTELKQPGFLVGTHAVLNKLHTVQPGLVIIDEQHRFGVRQRDVERDVTHHPHTLTMSATPIPRSYTLTIFAHLSISTIDELPAGRLPTKTWYVGQDKREQSLTWISDHLAEHPQDVAIIVCPFIEQSAHESLANVASAEETYKEVQAFFKKSQNHQKTIPTKIALLHGRMKKTDQQQIVAQLQTGEIDVLVTTPIVEVGLDVPTASIIVIEAAERFGLASLHQLRGRVGRAGQQGYCLLFSKTKSADSKQRLEEFCAISNGFELAEKDLARRGAGDIFGTQQHGFDQLRFADWANAELIMTARRLYDTLSRSETTWSPLLSLFIPTTDAPAAN